MPNCLIALTMTPCRPTIIAIGEICVMDTLFFRQSSRLLGITYRYVKEAWAGRSVVLLLARMPSGDSGTDIVGLTANTALDVRPPVSVPSILPLQTRRRLVRRKRCSGLVPLDRALSRDCGRSWPINNLLAIDGCGLSLGENLEKLHVCCSDGCRRFEKE